MAYKQLVFIQSVSFEWFWLFGSFLGKCIIVKKGNEWVEEITSNLLMLNGDFVEVASFILEIDKCFPTVLK